MTEPLLSVRDLAVTFATDRGVARAVDGVSFDIYPGETLAVVGESGSGKTVTALSLLRLLDEAATVSPASRIDYAGKNLLTLDDESLRRVRGVEIAMVFQDPMTSLNPMLRIGTQVTETLRAHGNIDRAAARRRAVELLELVGLPEPARNLDDYPHQLSGGMRQRVLIAIALSCGPKLLIADEPTTALDVTIQAQILELLADLKARLGMALLLISHDMGVVAGMADRVAVMYGGQIVELANTATLFKAPVHPYTAGLLAAIPRLGGGTAKARLDAIPGAVPPATAWPSGCRFHPRCRHAWEKCSSDPPPLDKGARCWLVTEPGRRKP
jgi:peptide/nickel transport system ATP-binding protein